MKENKDRDIMENMVKKNAEVVEIIQEVIDHTYTGRISQFLTSSFAFMIEYALYILGLLVILFVFIMGHVTPFYILDQMRDNDTIQSIINPNEINNFLIVTKGIIILLGLTIILVGYLLRKNRKYKSSIQDNLSSLKDVKKVLMENQE